MSREAFFGRFGPFWTVPTEVLPPAAVAGVGIGLVNGAGSLGGAVGPAIKRRTRYRNSQPRGGGCCSRAQMHRKRGARAGCSGHHPGRRGWRRAAAAGRDRHPARGGRICLVGAQHVSRRCRQATALTESRWKFESFTGRALAGPRTGWSRAPRPLRSTTRARCDHRAARQSAARSSG
jgi:hypothetical protein